MKKLNTLLKVCAIVLFVVAAISSCKKAEDPYAGYTAEREAGLISDWLAQMKTEKVAFDSTATKIYYVTDKTKTGTGPTVEAGDTVTVKYTGRFLDGTVFDASEYHGGTMKYVHKTDRLIQGWEEGIEVLSKGGSAAFLIPSAKAYGATGQGSIPPYTPLIFVIEVVDIK